MRTGRSIMRSRWGGRGIAPASLLLCPIASADAASPTLGQDQVQLLQQMSHAEREALLRKLLEDKRAQRDSIAPLSDVTEPKEVSDPVRKILPTRISEVPRLKAGDTVLVKFRRQLPPEDTKPAPSFAGDTRKKEEKKVPQQRIFVLDQFGSILLDGAGKIAVQGLSELEAAERVQAEAAFQGVEVSVKLLPVEQLLKPFGYELFVPQARKFTPATDIPVPADYVVGPGDTVVIQTYGKENTERELAVSRDGDIPFPGIGPIRVAGLNFSRIEQKIPPP